MKRRETYIALVLTALVLLLAGCNQSADHLEGLPEPSFTEGESYRYQQGIFQGSFRTMSSTAGPCTLSVQETIYEEKQAALWWYAIQSDLAPIYEVLNAAEDAYPPFTICVVDDQMPDWVQLSEDCWYCTSEEILSGAYKEKLLSVVLGGSETWKLTGITSIMAENEQQESFLDRLKSIFSGEDEPTDEEKLTAYLETGRNTQFLGLYGPYFSWAFASEMERSMAQIASKLLCEHVIEEHGGQMLIEDACIGCRQELLDEMGLDYTYVDNFGDFDKNYTYTFNGPYPLTVTTDRGDVFNIVRLSGDVTTPEDVCWLLYDAWKGPQVILEAVRAEAPECAKIFAENYRVPFTCNFYPERYGSVTYPTLHEIQLGHSSTIVHEIMHLFVPIEADISEQWKYEAYCEYLTQKYYLSHGYRADYFDAFTPEKLSTLKTPNIYLAHADLPQTMDEINGLLFAKSMLVADHIVLSEEEYAEKWASLAEEYQAIGGLADIPEGGGNAMSYQELAAFADYLVENYSLSTFLEYCLDPNAVFEETYGDFETIKAAWLEDLMSLADGLEFDESPKT